MSYREHNKNKGAKHQPHDQTVTMIRDGNKMISKSSKMRQTPEPLEGSRNAGDTRHCGYGPKDPGYGCFVPRMICR